MGGCRRTKGSLARGVCSHPLPLEKHLSFQAPFVAFVAKGVISMFKFRFTTRTITTLALGKNLISAGCALKYFKF